jgi:hypothetical protein
MWDYPNKIVGAVELTNPNQAIWVTRNLAQVLDVAYQERDGIPLSLLAVTHDHQVVMMNGHNGKIHHYIPIDDSVVEENVNGGIFNQFYVILHFDSTSTLYHYNNNKIVPLTTFEYTDHISRGLIYNHCLSFETTHEGTLIEIQDFGQEDQLLMSIPSGNDFQVVTNAQHFAILEFDHSSNDDDDSFVNVLLLDNQDLHTVARGFYPAHDFKTATHLVSYPEFSVLTFADPDHAEYGLISHLNGTIEYPLYLR